MIMIHFLRCSECIRPLIVISYGTVHIGTVKMMFCTQPIGGVHQHPPLAWSFTANNGRLPKRTNLFKMKTSLTFLSVLFAWLFLAISFSGAFAQDASTDSNPKSAEDSKAKKPSDEEGDNFDVTNEDWGTYYDPQNVFCGKYDCYKILGFDYESWGKEKPTTKLITKRYRRLSREWHPDKSKHKNAKEKFVKIARAYEVLTDVLKRAEYDKLRYDQAAYFQKYGSSVLWSYAPKSNAMFVIILLFGLGNVASWYIQAQRWNMVANRLIKAAVEDWTPSQGGSSESKQLRQEALDILEKRGAANGSDESNGKAGKKGSKAGKATSKEKKQKEQEEILPIVKNLVNEIEDFGGGFHKPTYNDLLAVYLAKAPLQIANALIWQSKFWIRRMQKKELNDEEKGVLTQRVVGPVTWDVSSDEERAKMIKRELWKKSNLAEWREEQEIKKLSPAEQKYISKMKKRGKLE